LEAYAFAFHHGGLSSSSPLKITTEEGFNDLVKYIIDILSIKDEAAYGLDPTRFQIFFCINNHYCGSVCFVHVRACHARVQWWTDPARCGILRGRSTIVT
jgi:hypothetical protein